MKSKTARAMEAITVVVGILGFIGGIVMGFTYNTLPDSLYGDPGFNVALMLTAWFCVFILCTIIYGVAQSAEYSYRTYVLLRDARNTADDQRIAEERAAHGEASGYHRVLAGKAYCDKCKSLYNLSLGSCPDYKLAITADKECRHCAIQMSVDHVSCPYCGSGDFKQIDRAAR